MVILHSIIKDRRFFMLVWNTFQLMETLSPDQKDRYFRLLTGYYAWVNMKSGIVPICPDFSKPEEITRVPIETVQAIQAKAFENPKRVLQYLKENPFGLTPDECSDVEAFQHSISDDFILVKRLRSYMVFLSQHGENRLYGVVLFSKSFELQVSLFPLPTLVKAVLIPMAGCISTDLIVHQHRFLLGPGYQREINKLYQETKARHGVITSLPLDLTPVADTDLLDLTGMLSSRQNLEEHYYEIQDILDRRPDLKVFYKQRVGDLYSRQMRKTLKDAGVVQGWFAALGHVLIAGGATREMTEAAVQGIIPKERYEEVYYFKVK